MVENKDASLNVWWAISQCIASEWDDGSYVLLKVDDVTLPT